MMGDAITTERPMFRAGERVSPARIAMYSKPVSAPSASLLATATYAFFMPIRLTSRSPQALSVENLVTLVNRALAAS